MNPEMTEPEAATPTSNAVSIFGQGGSPNDFPVLKAFQEYIDAEQAKARKRMLGLSIFFIVLLVVIVITFTLVVMSVINRNQSLSDRLLDIALREKTQAQPVVNVQSPAPAQVVQPVVRSQEESLKPVVEEIGKLSAAIKAQQQPQIQVPQNPPVVVNTAPQPVVQPTSETVELKRQNEEQRRKIEKLEAQVKAKEMEEKHQAEVEKHRRRLYPEHYARQDALKAADAARAERAANPADKVRTTETVGTETVGRATPPLPETVKESVVEPEPEPAPTTPKPQKPVSAPVTAQPQKTVPAPVTAQPQKTVSEPVKPPPQSPVSAPAAKPVPPPSPQTPQDKTVQPPSLLDRLPEKDPELDELLKNLKPLPASKPAQASAAKPAVPTVAKPQQSAAKPAPQTVAKPQQPAAKPAAQAIAKPQQPAAKSAAQPVVKPQPPVAKPTPPPPVAPVQAQPVQQTETLAIGGGDGNSIPWLIEIPQN